MLRSQLCGLTFPPLLRSQTPPSFSLCTPTHICMLTMADIYRVKQTYEHVCARLHVCRRLNPLLWIWKYIELIQLGRKHINYYNMQLN